MELKETMEWAVFLDGVFVGAIKCKKADETEVLQSALEQCKALGKLTQETEDGVKVWAGERASVMLSARIANFYSE